MTEPTVTVRYFAAAAAASGLVQELVTLEGDVSFAGLVERLGDGRPALAQVLHRCSFLHDEIAVRDLRQVVRPGSVVDVLPPFAGG